MKAIVSLNEVAEFSQDDFDKFYELFKNEGTIDFRGISTEPESKVIWTKLDE